MNQLKTWAMSTSQAVASYFNEAGGRSESKKYYKLLVDARILVFIKARSLT
jgi:hypothetical protein